MNYKKAYLYSLYFVFTASFGQPAKVLHYSETSGFDHQTRAASFAMFHQMGMQYGFTVDNDSTGDNFNSLSNLQQFGVVIFSNTSGDNILDATQQTNFEAYMNGNGAFIGIHAASDTYRHSTANGSNTGGWDWYAEMLGASVQQNPNHVNGTPVYSIDILQSHPLMEGIPDSWDKAEEYYYWENGYFNPENNILQKVEQTIGPNMMVNSYDSARAVTWYKILPGGGKSYYTTLGHDVSNYTSDTTFYTMLTNAIMWATDSITSVPPHYKNIGPLIYPNPAEEFIFVNNELPIPLNIKIYDGLGNEVLSQKLRTEKKVTVKDLVTGIYYVELNSQEKFFRTKFVKE